MAEEKINRVTIEDLPRPEKELTPEEARQIQGGLSSKEEQLKKPRTDSFGAAEEQKKSG